MQKAKQVMYREKVHYLFFCETVTLLAGGIAYIAVMVYNGVWETNVQHKNNPFKDYKRLKTEENSRLSLNWNLNRELSKLNYRIHTDAIKDNLIPPELTSIQISYTYASEADLLNVVLVGKTAKQWKETNSDKS